MPKFCSTVHNHVAISCSVIIQTRGWLVLQFVQSEVLMIFNLLIAFYLILSERPRIFSLSLLNKPRRQPSRQICRNFHVSRIYYRRILLLHAASIKFNYNSKMLLFRTSPIALLFVTMPFHLIALRVSSFRNGRLWGASCDYRRM